MTQTQAQFAATLREEVAIAIRKLHKSGVIYAEWSADLIIARMDTRRLAGMPGAPVGTNAQWVFADMVRKIANI